MGPIINAPSSFVLLFLNIISHISSSIADVLSNLFISLLRTFVQLVPHNEPQKTSSRPTPHEATPSSDTDVFSPTPSSTVSADVSLCYPLSSPTHLAPDQSSSSSNSFNINYTYDRTSSKLQRSKSSSKTRYNSRRTSICWTSSTTTSSTRSSSPASSISSATSESSLKSCLKPAHTESPNIKRRSSSPTVRFAKLAPMVKSRPSKITLRFQQHSKLGIDGSSSDAFVQDEGLRSRAIPTVKSRQTWYVKGASGYDISSAPAYPVSYDYARRAAAAAAAATATTHMYTASQPVDAKATWPDFDQRYRGHRVLLDRSAPSRASTKTSALEVLEREQAGLPGVDRGYSYPLQYLYPGCQTQYRSAYTAGGQAYYASRDVYAVAQSRVR